MDATKNGRDFQLGRKTQRRRKQAKLREIKEALRQRMHATIDEQGRWLGAVLRGYFAYFAVPTNSRALTAFRYHVATLWYRSLRRRSQKDRTTWERMTTLIERFLPPAHILHPWPDQRFRVKHSR